MFAKSALTVTALTALGLAASSHAATMTFDLSNVTVGTNPPQTTLNMAGGPGQVTNLEWNFSYSPLGISWAGESFIDLVSPTATPNPIVDTGSGASGLPSGRRIQTPANAGTFVWTTSPGPSWNGNPTPSYNLNWPSTSSNQTSTDSSSLLNGADANGNWTLNLTDAYNDNNGNFRFNSGSFVRVTYEPIPEPTTLALLAGFATLALRRRA